HIDEVVVQHALDAVACAQHLGDAVALQRGLDRAVSAGVDDGGRAAGLADDAGTLELRHKDPSFPNMSVGYTRVYKNLSQFTRIVKRDAVKIARLCAFLRHL